jgi:hypothetical protein
MHIPAAGNDIHQRRVRLQMPAAVGVVHRGRLCRAAVRMRPGCCGPDYRQPLPYGKRQLLPVLDWLGHCDHYGLQLSAVCDRDRDCGLEAGHEEDCGMQRAEMGWGLMWPVGTSSQGSLCNGREQMTE